MKKKCKISSTHTGCCSPGLGDADHEAKAGGKDESDAGKAERDQHWGQEPRGQQVQGQRAMGPAVRNYRDFYTKIYMNSGHRNRNM